MLASTLQAPQAISLSSHKFINITKNRPRLPQKQTPKSRTKIDLNIFSTLVF